MRTVFVVLLAVAPITLAETPHPMSRPGPMTPEPKRTWEKGPPLLPAETLKAWLAKQVDAQGKPRRVRLPVTVTLTPTGVDHRGVVGGGAGLVLELDDSFMGVGLADHARSAAKGKPTVTLLVDGTLAGDGRLQVAWIARVDSATPGHAEVEAVAAPP